MRHSRLTDPRRQAMLTAFWLDFDLLNELGHFTRDIILHEFEERADAVIAGATLVAVQRVGASSNHRFRQTLDATYAHVDARDEACWQYEVGRPSSDSAWQAQR